MHPVVRQPPASLDSPETLASTEIKLALAFSAYQAGIIRQAESSLRGYTHIVASRQGLYVVDETRCTLILHGLFFGVTVRADEIFVFECCDLPRSPTRRGRILRLRVHDHTITEATVIATGLDNGCHQIDFIGQSLHVVDTYSQRIIRFVPGETGFETLYPLPLISDRAEGPSYVHSNSILAVGDRILLLLHHGAQPTGRGSEIAVYDRSWQLLEFLPLRGSGCHGLALLPDGTLVTCGSMEGTVISPQGLRVEVSPWMTRGLSVGAASVVIGASQQVERGGRLRNSGTVTFMDPQFQIRAVLPVPGAPTEVRRLDGQDRSLSNFLAASGSRDYL